MLEILSLELGPSYRKAPRLTPAVAFQACKFVEENLAISVDKLGKDTLLNVAKTAMSSKIIGADSDFYAKLAVDAMLSVGHDLGFV